jgi:hypothetical protein
MSRTCSRTGTAPGTPYIPSRSSRQHPLDPGTSAPNPLPMPPHPRRRRRADSPCLLTARRNRALTQQWAVWLAGKDTERALKVRHPACFLFFLLTGRRKLLTAHDSAERGQKAGDEAATLWVVNPDAAAGFLRHLILQKRRSVSPFLTDDSPFYA